MGAAHRVFPTPSSFVQLLGTGSNFIDEWRTNIQALNVLVMNRHPSACNHIPYFPKVMCTNQNWNSETKCNTFTTVMRTSLRRLSLTTSLSSVSYFCRLRSLWSYCPRFLWNLTASHPTGERLRKLQWRLTIHYSSDLTRLDSVTQEPVCRRILFRPQLSDGPSASTTGLLSFFLRTIRVVPHRQIWPPILAMSWRPSVNRIQSRPERIKVDKIDSFQ